jgi:hypothetical protein
LGGAFLATGLGFGAAFLTTFVADFFPTAKVMEGAVKADAEATRRANAGANFIVDEDLKVCRWQI